MELFESLQFCSAQFLVDSKEQARVLMFFDQLRNSDTGWRDCIDIIVKEISSDDQLKFLCLQVIEYFLKTRYAHANNDDINLIRTLMIRWLEQLQRQTNVPYFLKNKMAQIFSLVFIVDFSQRWTTFLHDVFLTKLSDENVTEFYLRVLLAIDTEVADREIQRTKEECERNTLIRDKMREVCVLDMVSSLYQILVKHMRSNVKITNLCLNSIGAYVAWIEITLIANDRFVPIIVECLSLSDETQEAATDCVCSILTKGMEPALKMQLVRAMDKILEDTGVYRIDQDTDVDHLIKLAEIVNCIGCVLIDCYSKFIKSPQALELTFEILSMIEIKLNLMLSCLAHEDTLVSSSVIEFCHQYVVLLKQIVPLTIEQKKFVKELLLVNLRRYRFPDDYDHDHEGENEAEFLEFRKELKTIFTNIGMLEVDLTMETVEELVINTFTNWRQLSYRDVELAISLLFFLGEAMPSNQGNLFISTDKKALSLKKMVRMMIVSGVSHQNHVAVCLQYFETVCRYDKLFGMEPDLMLDTVTSFLDERGLHHTSGRIRSRATYLFSRFVRSQKHYFYFFTSNFFCRTSFILLRGALQQYVGQILFHLQDLLAVSPQTTERRISAEDQLFLFETAGTLIVSGNFNAEEKRNFMQQLLGSLINRFNEGLSLLDRTNDEEERRILVDYINNVMAYASRTSKAFSNQLTMKSCLCEDIFLQLMSTFLASIGPSHAPLLNGLRQYLHRMVICLGDELLPHLPSVLQKFLSIVTDLKALTDFLTLVQQAIAKYKADVIPFLKNDMISLYTTIWRALSVQVDPMDEVATRDAQYFRRSYYQLLSVIANNKLLELWTCVGSENLQIFLRFIVEGAMFVHDPIVQKQCFNMIHKCFDCCTVDNLVSLQWLFDFSYSQMLPACFAVPLKSEFDFSDAQSVMVISEIGAFIKRFFEIKGEEVFRFITQQLWMSAKLPEEAVNEFGFALKSMEAKAFQKYLKSFFERVCSQRT